MKNYLELTVEITVLQTQDVITASGEVFKPAPEEDGADADIF